MPERRTLHQFRNLIRFRSRQGSVYGDAAAASSQVSMGGGASKARGEGHVRVHYLDGKGVPQRGEGVHAEKIEGWSNTANELLWNSTKNMEYTFAIPCWLYSIMLFHITIPCVLFHIESRFDTVTRPPRGGGWLGPTMGLKHIC